MVIGLVIVAKVEDLEEEEEVVEEAVEAVDSEIVVSASGIGAVLREDATAPPDADDLHLAARAEAGVPATVEAQAQEKIDEDQTPVETTIEARVQVEVQSVEIETHPAQLEAKTSNQKRKRARPEVEEYSLRKTLKLPDFFRVRK